MSRSSKNKRRPRFTSRGKHTLQWSILMLGIGFYLKDPSLMILGIFLITLIIICFTICWLNFRGVCLKREMPGEVFANDMFTVYLSVRRLKGSPIFCISLKDYFLPEKKSNFLIPVVHREWDKCGQLRMKLPKRGDYKEAKCHLSSDFPLGFFKVEKTMITEVGITVYPEPLSFNNEVELFKGHENEAERENVSGTYNYGSFRGLREFAAGDPIRLISWSASTRSDTLMVRDMEPPEPEKFVVVFHSSKFRNILPDRKQFEKCLRILSGLFVVLQSNNRSFEFFSSLSDWEPVICDNPAEIPANALSMLASANFGEPDNFNAVKDILAEIPSHYHCIVVSASPLKSWLDRLPTTSCSLTCVDTKRSENIGAVTV
ncbi:MAG: DUF58 domain-containing protein [Lentisphaeraceae bacterium]|nr:DUF58 domain-containing protein [Lentisphaeraceae bacterium]